MKKLYTRKIILAAAVAVLAVIYAMQLILSSRSAEKVFKLEEPFDTIEIFSQDNGTLELKRSGDLWKAGDDELDGIRAGRLCDAVKEIRTLGVVSKISDDAASGRYGFTGAQEITVKVSGGGRELLSLEIGKDAASGQQNYVRINGGTEIYLASGALKTTFSVKKESIVKKIEEPAAETVSEAVGEAAAE